MSSSTSSSSVFLALRRGLQAAWAASARQVSAVAVSLAFAAVAIAAMAVVSGALPPRQGEHELEKIIVREQLRRTRTVRPDVLVIGDSSALMDVEARELSSVLQVDVESLATLGWVGPEGYGRMIQKLSERKASPRVVVLLMCQWGLAVDEATFAKTGYERMVLEDLTDDSVDRSATGRREAPHTDAQPGWRGRIHTRLFLPLVEPPLPGRLGFYYGWSEDVARVMDRSRGSLVDPSLPDLAALSVPCQFELSAAVERRLRLFAELTRGNSAQTIYFGITPVPQAAVVDNSLARRAATALRCLEALGLPASSELPVPAAFPTRRFATFSHLSAEGRHAYSQIMAQLLETRLPSSRR